MIHLVLYCPEIPQNTGNIGRTAAITNSRLHLIEPLGFSVTDKHLKRSGMDYWQNLDIHIHKDWQSFKENDAGPKRLWLFTTQAKQVFWDVRFEDGDGLLFGNEGQGAPEWLHGEIGDSFRVTIPHENADCRSLNLATAAGIAAFEAMRQLR